METIDLETLTLGHGDHSTRTEGVCLLEAVAWMAGETHSDAPKCVDRTLARFGRSWNDGMRSDEERGQLKPYVTALVGTAGSTADAGRRAWMALDWSVRVSTPAWLDLAGLADHAEKLRGLPQVVAPDIDVLAALEDARNATAAAWAAAWTAAGAAAGAAAWDAAGAAAWDAAWDAAGAAARAAARDALDPTVTRLQASAHHLYLDMIAAGPHNPAALAVARATILGGES